MKRIFCAILCCLLTLGLLPVQSTADSTFDLGQFYDPSILAGGIYDLYAYPEGGTDDYTYQWQVDVGMGTGNWSDLTDNANPYGYRGSNTYHLELVTAIGNGMIIGTGWENIPFQCVVTNKKTGVSRVTASIYMHVFTSDDLDSYLQKQGFGLYEPNVEGAKSLTTSNYIQYNATGYAGKPLTLFCGCWRPSGEHLLRASNFTENVEIWITENGKTVKKDNNTVYIPYTIGTNAVTIQYKLHHTLGIHDLGYYETKTVSLTTQEPDMIGYATANSQISLLKEQYNESQKLVSIPKGTQIKVVGKSGGWYQAVVDGYIGYVATSSVSFREYSPIIDHVDLTVAEPVAGMASPTTCTISPNSCTVTSVEWLDLTDDRFLSPGERFVKGHSYQLVVWATAKEGYQFKLNDQDKMLTTAIINGNLPAFTSRAYEQIIGKVIDIRYDFPNVKEPESHNCSPMAVAKVPPTCTQSGFEAYYRCSCGKTYSDSTGNNQVNLSTWGTIPATGHNPTTWRYNQTEHYKFCQNCSEMLDLAEHTGGTATCTQKPVCSVCKFAYGMVEPSHRWGPGFDYKEELGHAWICADCKAHDALRPHTPGPTATDDTPQTCTDCGYILAPAKNHTHRLTPVQPKEPTCTQDGNLEYYICDGCSDWFSEADPSKIINKTTVLQKALGHSPGKWKYDQDMHWQVCTRCNALINQEHAPHEDGDADSICDICHWQIGSAIVPEAQSPQTTPQEQAPQESPGPTASNPAKIWLLIVLTGLACFGAAVTAGVIILKKKEGSN